MPAAKDPAATGFVTIFDETYNQPDARAYYRMLWQLGYRNHVHAVPVFRAVQAELARVRGLSEMRVFDFASSYGIVSALLKHEIDPMAFLQRYPEAALDQADAQQMAALDRAWLGAAPERTPGTRFAAIDVADKAIAYGQAVGLFDAAFVEDIQQAPPSPPLEACLAQVELVVECGSVAHLIPNALERVLGAAKKTPWVVTSPVRGNERAAAFEVMRDHGLVVETLGLPPFLHRRFRDAEEQARGVAIAQEAGHDTRDYEETGALYAQVYVARPEGETTPPEAWGLPPQLGQS